MNFSTLAILAALLVFSLAMSPAFGQASSYMSSRELNDKVKGLDESTRKRVLAMQQAGMPEEAIAKKIQYEVGGAGTARRVLEKLNVEEVKKSWAHQQRQRFQSKKSVNMNKIAAERKKNSNSNVNGNNRRG
jgi:hypothetical protein